MRTINNPSYCPHGVRLEPGMRISKACPDCTNDATLIGGVEPPPLHEVPDVRLDSIRLPRNVLSPHVEGVSLSGEPVRLRAVSVQGGVAVLMTGPGGVHHLRLTKDTAIAFAHMLMSEAEK